MDRVGILGVGAMGGALLERLKLAGVGVVAYDSHPPSLDAARSSGADIASSAAELARRVTIIDVVVRTDQDVLDCMMGGEGVLEGAESGTLVLLHSTIFPQTTQKVAEAGRGRGVHVVDACMAGVPSTVREGRLGFLVGGVVDVVERGRPHLLRMGDQVLHVGPLGAGNVAKLMLNLISGSETLIVHEAIRIGEAAGIPYRDSLEILRRVYSGHLLERWQGTFDPTGRSATPRAGRNILGKDLPMAAELARQFSLDLPITEELVAAARRLMESR